MVRCGEARGALRKRSWPRVVHTSHDVPVWNLVTLASSMPSLARMPTTYWWIERVVMPYMSWNRRPPNGPCERLCGGKERKENESKSKSKSRNGNGSKYVRNAAEGAGLASGEGLPERGAPLLGPLRGPVHHVGRALVRSQEQDLLRLVVVHNRLLPPRL